MRIGIISAMEEENNLLKANVKNISTVAFADRIFTKGTLFGQEVVLAFSRCGKVAATITTMFLLMHFNVDLLVFTGVAGSVHDKAKIGDVVISSQLVQHDMDARPLFERFEIPLTGTATFSANVGLSDLAYSATEQFFRSEDLSLPYNSPAVYLGDIASGDKFFSSKAQLDELRRALPDILCVEMEGAAVAQVCQECGVPFTIIRTISDNGDEGAAVDFNTFINSVASRYSYEIMSRMIPQIPKNYSCLTSN